MTRTCLLGLNRKNQQAWYDALDYIRQRKRSEAARVLVQAHASASDGQKAIFNDLIAKAGLNHLFETKAGKLRTADETKKDGMKQAAKAVLARTSGKSLSKPD